MQPQDKTCAHKGWCVMAAKLEETSTPGIFKRGHRYAVIYRDAGGCQRQESARTFDTARDCDSSRSGRSVSHSRSVCALTEFWEAANPIKSTVVIVDKIVSRIVWVRIGAPFDQPVTKACRWKL